MRPERLCPSCGKQGARPEAQATRLESGQGLKIRKLWALPSRVDWEEGEGHLDGLPKQVTHVRDRTLLGGG